MKNYNAEREKMEPELIAILLMVEVFVHIINIQHFSRFNFRAVHCSVFLSLFLSLSFRRFLADEDTITSIELSSAFFKR